MNEFINSNYKNVSTSVNTSSLDQTKAPIKQENIYQATSFLNETSKKKEITKAVAACLTLGISVILSEGQKVMKLGVGQLLTSAGILDKKSRSEDLKAFQKEYPNHGSFSDKIKITTAENATLDGMILKPERNAETPQKTVIWLNGYGQSYESKLSDAAKYAEAAGVNVLVFNYRGSGDSTGHLSSANDMVRDTLSMVEFLSEKKGISPENIIIHGYSMSGGVGAKVASSVPGIKTINDRSFSSFSNAVKDMISSDVKSRIGDKAANIIGSLAGLAIKLFGFESNTKKIYADINPSSRKNLEERTLIVYHKHDNVITAKTSLKNHQAQDLKLSSREFVNIAPHNQIKNLEELKNLWSDASFKYTEIPSYGVYSKAFKGLESSKGKDPSFIESQSYLSGKLEKILKEKESLLKPDSFLPEKDMTELKNDIQKLKSVLSSLDPNPHGVSFLYSEDGTKAIIDFIKGKEQKNQGVEKEPLQKENNDIDSIFINKNDTQDNFDDLFKK